MRIPFASLFEERTNNVVEPRLPIRLGGVTINPGTQIQPGSFLGGIDLTTYRGRDFEVDVEGGVYVIKGIY